MRLTVHQKFYHLTRRAAFSRTLNPQLFTSMCKIKDKKHQLELNSIYSVNNDTFPVLYKCMDN